MAHWGMALVHESASRWELARDELRAFEAFVPPGSVWAQGAQARLRMLERFRLGAVVE